MCQLMGMSANVSTDAQFDFAGLIERDGVSDRRRDGWGFAPYQPLVGVEAQGHSG